MEQKDIKKAVISMFQEDMDVRENLPDFSEVLLKKKGKITVNFKKEI